jgi:hypothetical protein
MDFSICARDDDRSRSVWIFPASNYNLKVFKDLGECQREESNQRANNPKQATTTSN